MRWTNLPSAPPRNSLIAWGPARRFRLGRGSTRVRLGHRRYRFRKRRSLRFKLRHQLVPECLHVNTTELTAGAFDTLFSPLGRIGQGMFTVGPVLIYRSAREPCLIVTACNQRCRVLKLPPSLLKSMLVKQKNRIASNSA